MPVLDRFLDRVFAVAWVLVMLGGCSTPSGPPREVYTEVKVAAPVSCVPKGLTPAPTGLLAPAQLLAIPDGPSRYVAMAEDWFLRVRRMNETEVVIEACAKAAPAP